MKTRLLRFTIAFLILGIVTGALSRPSPVYAATYTVNTTDSVTDGTCNARHCSLMEAVILAAMHRGPDEIRFNIMSPGPLIIAPVDAFPSSSNPWWFGFRDPECPLSTDADCYADLTIDGTTQPGYAGIPLIILDGSYELSALGNLHVGSRSVVKGISFVNWPATPVRWPPLGVSASAPALSIFGSDVVVEDSYFGLDPSGAVQGNGEGIWVSGENHTIRRNTISGNQIGIDVLGAVPGTVIEGNRIGTDPSGSTAIGNAAGIMLRIFEGDSGGVYIGGGPDDGNVISGNETGIMVESDDNRILGNRIGTNLAGDAALRNGIGIYLTGSDNIIGGSAGNLISGNGRGLRIHGGERNYVSYNRFGTDAGGGADIPNDVAVLLSDTTGAHLFNNVIAFSVSHGLVLLGTSRSRISNNEIFRNGAYGIFLGFSGINPSTRIMISENSIFNNGGLGIRFDEPAMNEGVNPPDLSRVTSSSAEGTACPGCWVELFLSDDDPGGSGEGKTYLTGVSASTDGAFRTDLGRSIGPCESLTATATDDSGNTSEFSRNFGVGMCLRIPPLISWIWIFGAGAAGAGVALLVVVRRRPLTIRHALWLILGAFLGIVIGLLFLFLPFVQITWPSQGGQVPPTQGPAASTASPQLASETLTAIPQVPPSITPTATLTTTPTVMPTSTQTLTSSVPIATLRQNANCRRGPSTDYDIVTSMPQGLNVPIVARNQNRTWWQVQVPGTQTQCWIADVNAETSGDTSGVPVVESPPLGCWVKPNQGPEKCVVPCPQGAKPGGACTP